MSNKLLNNLLGMYKQAKLNKKAESYKSKVAELLNDINEPSPIMDYISESEAEEICKEIGIPHEASWYKGDLFGYIDEVPDGMVDVLIEHISEEDAESLWRRIAHDMGMDVDAKKQTKMSKKAEEKESAKKDYTEQYAKVKEIMKEYGYGLSDGGYIYLISKEQPKDEGFQVKFKGDRLRVELDGKLKYSGYGPEAIEDFLKGMFYAKKLSSKNTKLTKKAGWKIMTPKDLTDEITDEFLKDAIKRYAGHVKSEDFYLVKGIKEKEDDQFDYDWEEGMFGEWSKNAQGEVWYSLTDLGNGWDYIYLIKEDKLYKMPNREKLIDFGVSSAKKLSSKAKTLPKKAESNDTLWLLSGSGNIEIEAPKDLVLDVAVSGDNSAAVQELKEAIKEKLSKYSTEDIKSVVKEYAIDGTDKMDRDTLEDYLVWLLAWDAAERDNEETNDIEANTKKKAGIDPNVSAEEIVKLNFDMPIEKADKVKEQFNEKGIKYESRKGKYTVEFSVNIEAGKVDLVYEIVRNIKKMSSTKKIATIKHENGVYNVYSESGKCLGKGYKTKEEAEKRLKQVEYFKHKKASKEDTYEEWGISGDDIDEWFENYTKAKIFFEKNKKDVKQFIHKVYDISGDEPEEIQVDVLYDRDRNINKVNFKTQQNKRTSLKQVVISKMAENEKIDWDHIWGIEYNGKKYMLHENMGTLYSFISMEDLENKNISKKSYITFNMMQITKKVKEGKMLVIYDY